MILMEEESAASRKEAYSRQIDVEDIRPLRP